MRSQFFHEIAESRERFYSQQLGDYPRKPAATDATPLTEPDPLPEDFGWGDVLGRNRRRLLRDFVGKMKFWIGF